MSKPLPILSNDTPLDDKPWYGEGLRFKCTGCGKCCTGAPGYIWLSEEEIHQIAAYLKLTVKDFTRQYLRLVHGRFSIREVRKSRSDDSYDCIFLDNKQCKIYPVRPTQCQTFPWWPQNISSKEQWEDVAHFCEGVNHPEAPIVPFDQIRSELQRQLSSMEK